MPPVKSALKKTTGDVSTPVLKRTASSKSVTFVPDAKKAKIEDEVEKQTDVPAQARGQTKRKSETRNFKGAIEELINRVVSSEDLDLGIKEALKKEENVLTLMELVSAEQLYKLPKIVDALALINWPDFADVTQNRFLDYLLEVVRHSQWLSPDFDQSPYQKVLITLSRNIYKPSSSVLPSNRIYSRLRAVTANKCKSFLWKVFTETQGGDRVLQSMSKLWTYQLFSTSPTEGIEDFLKFLLSLYGQASDQQKKTIFGLYLQKLTDFELAKPPASVPPEKHGEFEEKKIQTLDILYASLFRFFDELCSCDRSAAEPVVGNPEQLQDLFQIILEPLCVVVPTKLEDAKFVQYVPMYFMALDVKFKDMFVKALVNKCSERVSKDKSNEACGYLYGVIGAYIEVKTGAFILHLKRVVRWLKNYASRITTKSTRGPSFSSHLNFYNVAQGFFQAISLRRESFAESFGARCAVAELKSTVEDLINGYLNPLRFVAPSVAEEFVPAAVDVGIAQPSAKYEDVKREIIPVAGFTIEALPYLNSYEAEFTMPSSSEYVSMSLYRPFRPKVDPRRPENRGGDSDCQKPMKSDSLLTVESSSVSNVKVIKR